MDKIKIGIVGYGNIGRGVEQAIKPSAGSPPCSAPRRG